MFGNLLAMFGIGENERANIDKLITESATRFLALEKAVMEIHAVVHTLIPVIPQGEKIDGALDVAVTVLNTVESIGVSISKATE